MKGSSEWQSIKADKWEIPMEMQMSTDNAEQLIRWSLLLLSVDPDSTFSADVLQKANLKTYQPET